MRAKLSVIIVLCVLAIGSSAIWAQERTSRESKPGKHIEGTMMWRAMVGAGFLHDHMNSMIRQMSGMMRMMSKMMEAGKMDAKKMKLLSEIMDEMSTMMNEMPAVQKMIEERPDLAMKDMGKMMKTMFELMEKMAPMMAEMPT